jgi:hypothetical protein
MPSLIRWTYGGAGAILLLLGLAPMSARAQDRPKRFNIWDIHIGEAASEIPDEFINLACGTNGGPPAMPLKSFTEFRKCKPDANGLREVYFEYDDELEYQARALGDRARLRMYGGTTAFEFPIVASLLFDDAGRVRGERMITDPRQHVSRDRIEFWELGNFLRQRFGDEGWACEDLQPAEGESPAGTTFLKNHCEKTADGLRLILEQRYFEKKGQHFIDPQSGKPQPDAFESATRFEMYDAALPPRMADSNDHRP